MTAREALKHLSSRQDDRLLTVLTVLLALMMFVVAPLQASGFYNFDFLAGAIAIAMVISVVMLSANIIASVAMVIAFGLNLWVVIARVNGAQHSPVHIFFAAVSWLTIVIALGWPVGRAVFGPGRVTYHRIIGAVLLYLLIALAFVSLFTLAWLFLPDAFSGMILSDSPSLASTMIYFSVVTLTTVGYGDILPVHPIVRSLCNLESIIGQFYTATLLARLVTLHAESRK